MSKKEYELDLCPTCGSNDKKTARTRLIMPTESAYWEPIKNSLQWICTNPWHDPDQCPSCESDFPFDPYDKSDKEKAEAIFKGLPVPPAPEAATPKRFGADWFDTGTTPIAKEDASVIDEGSPEKPFYRKVEEGKGGATKTFLISCSEGWRESIVCTGMYEWAADWLVSELQGRPFAPDYRPDRRPQP